VAWTASISSLLAPDGFVTNSDAQYMMWDENSFAYTSSMRLGCQFHLLHISE